MEGQDEFIMHKSDSADVGLGEDCEDVLADVGCNADLYIVNQEKQHTQACSVKRILHTITGDGLLVCIAPWVKVKTHFKSLTTVLTSY